MCGGASRDEVCWVFAVWMTQFSFQSLHLRLLFLICLQQKRIQQTQHALFGLFIACLSFSVKLEVLLRYFTNDWINVPFYVHTLGRRIHLQCITGLNQQEYSFRFQVKKYNVLEIQTFTALNLDSIWKVKKVIKRKHSLVLRARCPLFSCGLFLTQRGSFDRVGWGQPWLSRALRPVPPTWR